MVLAFAHGLGSLTEAFKRTPVLRIAEIPNCTYKSHMSHGTPHGNGAVTL